MNKTGGYVLVRSVVMIVSCLIVLLIVLLGLRAGQAAARDEQRLRDVGSIAKALKTYKEYNQVYPEALNGRPKELSAYLEFWPEPPKKDGVCTKESNTYAYDQLDRGESYHLSFCLGKTSGGYPAGFNIVQP